jgi:hypothetical protein
VTARHFPFSRVFLVLAVVLFAGWTVHTVSQRKASFTIILYNTYATRAQQTSLRQLYDEQCVEYPPLAVGLLLGSRLAADALAPWYHLVVPPDPIHRVEHTLQFGRTFGLIGCVVQTGVFVAIFQLTRRLYPKESRGDRAGRLFAYVGGLVLMGSLVHQRLDAMLGAMVLLSLVLLLKRWWLPAFAVLAAGIDFKLVPAALAPLWLFASLPGDLLAEARAGRRLPRFCLVLAGRGAVLGVLIVAWALPFYVVGGARSLAFFAYHQERSIHCESTYGMVLMLLRQLGQPLEPRFVFGCWELHSPLTPVLAIVSSLLLGAGLLAACLLSFLTLARKPADGGVIAGLATLTLMTFAGLGKVFSPQYVLWVLPLLPLLPLRGRERVGFFVSFLLACLLTRQGSHVFGGEVLTGGPALYTTLILIARTVLWLGLMAWLALRLGSQPKPATPAEPLLSRAA